MTNFTRDIKKDLLSVAPDDGVLSYAFSAILSTGGCKIEEEEINLVSGSERVAEYFLSVCERLGVEARLKKAMKDPKSAQDRLTFSLDGNAVRARFTLPPSPDEEGEDFQSKALAYLRASFLGGGCCTIPHERSKTGFHLEFRFFDGVVSNRFCAMLDGLELWGREHAAGKGNKFIVYLSSREAISDFLSVSGARSALKKFESISVERERNNRENRVNNCYIGNADKTAIASAEHIVALTQLQESGMLETLPEPLKKAAEYRIRYPMLSLSELAQKMGISKSCLNHRMRKLMQIKAGTDNRI